jgi:hypothetical protein
MPTEKLYTMTDYSQILKPLAVYFGTAITFMSTFISNAQGFIGIAVGMATLVYTVFLIKNKWLENERLTRELRRPPQEGE